MNVELMIIIAHEMNCWLAVENGNCCIHHAANFEYYDDSCNILQIWARFSGIASV